MFWCSAKTIHTKRPRQLIKPIILVTRLESLAIAVEDHTNRAPDHGYQEPGDLGHSQF